MWSPLLFLLKDSKYPVEVRLNFVAFQKENIIKNLDRDQTSGKKIRVTLTNFASSMLHWDADKYWLTQFHGDWAQENANGRKSANCRN